MQLVNLQVQNVYPEPCLNILNTYEQTSTNDNVEIRMEVDVGCEPLKSKELSTPLLTRLCARGALL